MPVTVKRHVDIEISGNYPEEKCCLIRSKLSRVVDHDCQVTTIDNKFKKFIRVASADAEVSLKTVNFIKRQISEIELAPLENKQIENFLQSMMQNRTFFPWLENLMNDNEIVDVKVVRACETPAKVLLMSLGPNKRTLFEEWFKKVIVEEKLTILHYHNDKVRSEVKKEVKNLEKDYFVHGNNYGTSCIIVEGVMTDMLPFLALLEEELERIQIGIQHLTLDPHRIQFINRFGRLSNPCHTVIENNQICIYHKNCVETVSSYNQMFRALKLGSLEIDKYLYKLNDKSADVKKFLYNLEKKTRCCFLFQTINTKTIDIMFDNESDLSRFKSELTNYISSNYMVVILDVKIDHNPIEWKNNYKDKAIFSETDYEFVINSNDYQRVKRSILNSCSTLTSMNENNENSYGSYRIRVSYLKGQNRAEFVVPNIHITCEYVPGMEVNLAKKIVSQRPKIYEKGDGNQSISNIYLKPDMQLQIIRHITNNIGYEESSNDDEVIFSQFEEEKFCNGLYKLHSEISYHERLDDVFEIWTEKNDIKKVIQFCHCHNKLVWMDVLNKFEKLRKNFRVQLLIDKNFCLTMEGFRPDVMLVVSLLEEELERIQIGIQHLTLDPHRIQFINRFVRLSNPCHTVIENNQICIYHKNCVETVSSYNKMFRALKLGSLEIDKYLYKLNDKSANVKKFIYNLEEKTRCCFLFQTINTKTIDIMFDNESDLSRFKSELTNYISSNYMVVILDVKIDHNPTKWKNNYKDKAIFSETDYEFVINSNDYQCVKRSILNSCSTLTSMDENNENSYGSYRIRVSHLKSQNKAEFVVPNIHITCEYVPGMEINLAKKIVSQRPKIFKKGDGNQSISKIYLKPDMKFQIIRHITNKIGYEESSNDNEVIFSQFEEEKFCNELYKLHSEISFHERSDDVFEIWTEKNDIKKVIQFCHCHNKLVWKDVLNKFEKLRKNFRVQLLIDKNFCLTMEGFRPDVMLVVPLLEEQLQRIQIGIQHLTLDPNQIQFINRFVHLSNPCHTVIENNQICIYHKNCVETVSSYNKMFRALKLESLEIDKYLYKLNDKSANVKKFIYNLEEKTRCCFLFQTINTKTIDIMYDNESDLSRFKSELTNYISSNYMVVILDVKTDHNPIEWKNNYKDKAIFSETDYEFVINSNDYQHVKRSILKSCSTLTSMDENNENSYGSYRIRVSYLKGQNRAEFVVPNIHITCEYVPGMEVNLAKKIVSQRPKIFKKGDGNQSISKIYLKPDMKFQIIRHITNNIGYEESSNDNEVIFSQFEEEKFCNELYKLHSEISYHEKSDDVFEIWTEKNDIKKEIQFCHCHNKLVWKDVLNKFEKLRKNFRVQLLIDKNFCLTMEGFRPDVMLVVPLLEEELEKLEEHIRHLHVKPHEKPFINKFQYFANTTHVVLENGMVCFYGRGRRHMTTQLLRIFKTIKVESIKIEKYLYDNWPTYETFIKDLENETRCLHVLQPDTTISITYDNQSNLLKFMERFQSFITSKYMFITFDLNIGHDPEELKNIYQDKILASETNCKFLINAEDFPNILNLTKKFCLKVQHRRNLNVLKSDHVEIFYVEIENKMEFAIPHKKLNFSFTHPNNNLETKQPKKIVHINLRGSQQNGTDMMLSNYFKEQWFDVNPNTDVELKFTLHTLTTDDLEEGNVEEIRPLIGNNNFLAQINKMSFCKRKNLKFKLETDEQLLFLPLPSNIPKNMKRIQEHIQIKFDSFELFILHKNADEAAFEGLFSGKMLICKVHMGSCYEVPQGSIYNSFRPPCEELDKCDKSFKDGTCTSHLSFDSVVLKKTIKVNNVECVYEKVLITDVKQCCPVFWVEYTWVSNGTLCCCLS